MHKGLSAVVFSELKGKVPGLKSSGFQEMLRRVWREAPWGARRAAVGYHGAAALREKLRVIPDGYYIEGGQCCDSGRKIVAVEIEDSSRVTWEKACAYADLMYLLEDGGLGYFFNVLIVDRLGTATEWDPERLALRLSPRFIGKAETREAAEQVMFCVESEPA